MLISHPDSRFLEDYVDRLIRIYTCKQSNDEQGENSYTVTVIDWRRKYVRTYMYVDSMYYISTCI